MSNGIRKNDIKNKELLLRRLTRWLDDGFKVVGGHLWCTYCKSQIGSGADAVTKHVQALVHTRNKARSTASDVDLNALQAALEEYRQTAIDSGVQYQGMACVPEETQLARAECLEEILKAGIEPHKIQKLRPWLERRMHFSLVAGNRLMETYFPPLQLKERRLLTDSFKDAFIGCYHDGTTHEGELLSIVYRAVQPGFKFAIKLVRMPHLEKSLNADHIKALLHSTISSMQTHPHRVLAFMSDCAAPNFAAYNDGLKEMYPYADCNGCLPHTGHHVGQKLETPNVNEFMLLYNACVGHSTLARMLFRESTGKAPLRCSKTLWFSINDVQEKSLLPNALNGNLQTWVDALRRVDACPAIAPKMQEFFTASTHKVRMFQLELTVLVHVGVEARLFEDGHFPIVIVHGCIHISEIPLEPPPTPPPYTPIA
jgi:hypothetical protein